MSSQASLERAGRQTKHPIVCLNGGGEGDPHVLVEHIEPGTIVAWGTDDDMVSMVVANVEDEILTGEGKKKGRTLLLFGCFGEPGSYEQGRLLQQWFSLRDSVAVLLEPGMY